MFKQSCLALLVVAVALCTQALASTSDEGSSLLHSIPSSPSPASESSLPAVGSSSASVGPSPLKEQEVRTKDSSVRLFNGRKGGKLLIFENQNNMVKVEMPKTQVDHAAVEEESLKSHSEQLRKKEAEDRLEDEKEARIKRDRSDRDKQQQQQEQDAKTKQIEAAKEQAAEAERKAKLEDEVKEQQHKTSERQAREQRAKREEKEQEESNKKRDEDDQKAAARRNEIAIKAKAEQDKKASEFQIDGGWRNYDHGYLQATVDIVKNICFVSGLLAGNSGQVGTLPPQCRPTQGRLIFTAHKGDVNARVDVLPDGRMFHITGGGGSWMSLSNIWFPLSNERPITLVNGWVNYDYGYRPTTLVKQDGICFVSGLIRNGRWAQLAALSDDCSSSQSIIFSGNNHDQISRIDVAGNRVQFNGGSSNHAWVNLDGIAFLPGDGGQDLSLGGGYTVYGYGWRPPRWAKVGNVCVVTGLVRSSAFPYLVATLPDSCRPRARLIFGCNVHVRNARLDVLPNGEIHYINGRVYDWISLDCIKFVTA